MSKKGQGLRDCFQPELSRAELVLAVLALQQAVLDWERFAREPHERDSVAVYARLRAEEYQALAKRLGKMLALRGPAPQGSRGKGGDRP
jgi:hypothetical protein